MPELPEVETVCLQLNQLTAGRRIRNLEVNDPKLAELDPGLLCDCRIHSVQRLGKQVVFNLIPYRQQKVARWLVIHLRMTGRLLVTERCPAQRAETGPARFILHLDHGTVRFQDTRRFGTAMITDDFNRALPKGLEPLSPEFTWQRLRELCANSRMPLKTWLLRQDRLVGLGNIYASEICFCAGIHPGTPVGVLDRGQLQTVARCTRSILRAAIKHCGTTFSDFQDATGSTGSYVKYLRVYGRENQPCRICQTPVARFTQGQRSTFFCPTCQPSPVLRCE